MVRYAGFGGLFNEVWKMSFQGKKIQILVFYLPLLMRSSRKLLWTFISMGRHVNSTLAVLSGLEPLNLTLFLVSS